MHNRGNSRRDLGGADETYVAKKVEHSFTS